jgi:hypothetical protein
MNNEDTMLRDLMISSASQSVINDEPTVFSMQDSIDLMKKKFGDDWINYEFSRVAVVWQSSIFKRDHVKEVCRTHKGLYELCQEYYHYGTIEGKIVSIDFYEKLFYFQESFNSPKPENDDPNEILGLSPLGDAYVGFLPNSEWCEKYCDELLAELQKKWAKVFIDNKFTHLDEVTLIIEQE